MLKNHSKLESIEACHTKTQLFLRDLFLERFNDYLSDSLIAEHKGISEATIKAMIEEGKKIHEQIVSLYRM